MESVTDHWFSYDPFNVATSVKAPLLLDTLNNLTAWHWEACPEYRRVLRVIGSYDGPKSKVEDLPFIPVRLFKEYELMSIDRAQIFKTMYSSGTTGQRVSKIFLDRATASLQTKVLSRIMRAVLGKSRLPMLIVDTPTLLQNRASFSARTAGVLGFMTYGTDVTFALKEDMSLDLDAIETFVRKHVDESVFVFGFTFIVWQHFVSPLKQLGLKLPFTSSLLLHGGGWKQLQSIAVDSDTFRSEVSRVTGIDRVVNYYGMVEQTGSLFVECSHGMLHCPIFSDVVVRDPLSLHPLGVGKKGLIQVLSMIPQSYPGHSLLTEDLGVIHGEDDCACGWSGKYFTVEGRIPKSEPRGCSDTFQPRR